MTLNWESYKSYLLIDRKISDKKSNLWAIKSRFLIFSEYFKERNFSRLEFNGFISSLKNKGLSNSTLNKYITLGKSIDKFLNKEELKDYNYFHESRIILREILTPDEIKRLSDCRLNYKKFSDYINGRQKVLILLLGTTGARIGELLDLKWQDTFSSFMRFLNTKNGDTRDVPISDEILRLLLTLPKKGEYVFTSGRNGKLDAPQVNLDLKRRAKKCGISKPITCHLFRHSYITQMLEIGVDWLDLSVIVGHKDPKTTLRYKQSLLNHYREIIYLHPLLHGQMPWDMVIKKIKAHIDKTVDSTKYRIVIEETINNFSIDIYNIQKV